MPCKGFFASAAAKRQKAGKKQHLPRVHLLSVRNIQPTSDPVFYWSFETKSCLEISGGGDDDDSGGRTFPL